MCKELRENDVCLRCESFIVRRPGGFFLSPKREKKQSLKVTFLRLKMKVL